MRNNSQTWNYLKEMNAIQFDEKVVVSDTIINGKIAIYTRKYFKKRNNKTCYVDCNIKSFEVDFNRVKEITQHSNIYINDWNNKHFKFKKSVLLKNYKEELINQYKNLVV